MCWWGHTRDSSASSNQSQLNARSRWLHREDDHEEEILSDSVAARNRLDVTDPDVALPVAPSSILVNADHNESLGSAVSYRWEREDFYTSKTKERYSKSVRRSYQNSPLRNISTAIKKEGHVNLVLHTHLISPSRIVSPALKIDYQLSVSDNKQHNIFYRSDSPYLNLEDRSRLSAQSGRKRRNSSPTLFNEDHVDIVTHEALSTQRRNSYPNISVMDGLKTLRLHGGESPSETPQTHSVASRPNTTGKLLQLTPLWEQVVKNHKVPTDVNKEVVFAELGARLCDPEWEVRQHAMIVLTDLIPVMDSMNGELDLYISPVVLSELVSNLGHSAPAVRKGALDTLRVYLKHSLSPETALRTILNQGLENQNSGNFLQSNITMGVILSIPSLLFPLVSPQTGIIISQEGLVHLVSALSKKLVQVSYQEQALKSMVKIRDMVGEVRFDRFLEGFHPQCKRDFDILCKVYDMHSYLGDSGIDMQLLPSFDDYQPVKEDSLNAFENEREFWTVEPTKNRSRSSSPSDNLSQRDQNKNIISADKSSTDSEQLIYEHYASKNEETRRKQVEENQHSVDDGGVSQENDLEEEEDDDYVSDREDSSEEENYDMEDNGGRDKENSEEREVVLLKEKDGMLENVVRSSEELVVDENVIQNGKIILETEIKFSEDTAITMTILEENDESSPEREIAKKNKTAATKNDEEDSLEEDAAEAEMYSNDFVMKVMTDDEEEEELDLQPMRRTPRRVRFGGEMVMMRTPDSDVGSEEQEEIISVTTIQGQERPPSRSGRIPSGNTNKDTQFESITKQDNKCFDIPTVIVESVSFEKGNKPTDRRPRSSLIPLPVAPVLSKPRETNMKGPVFERHKKMEESPTVVKIFGEPVEEPRKGDPKLIYQDSGESITSSSDGDLMKGGEERRTNEERRKFPVHNGGNWEELGIVSQSILNDLRNKMGTQRRQEKEDWCARVRAVETLNLYLTQPDNLRRLPPYLPSLLHTLLVTLADDRNYRVATSALGVVRALTLSLPPPTLQSHLQQLVTGLARHIGGSGRVNIKIEAVQAAKVLMQAVRPGPVIEVLLTNNCIGAKSSRMRENSLLFILYAAQTFPSTEFDWQMVAERVAASAADPRRRVRQAALDAIAVLSQFVAPRSLDRSLRRVADSLASVETRDAFLTGVQARLSRRQLPYVSQDGLILYALQIPASRCSGKVGFHGTPAGADVDWILAGSGSVSPGSAKSRGQLMAAQRVESPGTSLFSSSDASILSSRNREGHPGGNPWTNRRDSDMMAVGVGVARSQSAVSSETRGGSQVTWALVPVTTLSHNTDDQRPRGSLWSSDLTNSGPSLLSTSHGSYRPLYLRFQTGGDDTHQNSAGRGFSLLPNKLVPRVGIVDGAVTQERLGQSSSSWQHQQPHSSSSSSQDGGHSPRVLTPSQHRGRRTLEPISGVREQPPAVLEESFPRRATPVQARETSSYENRHKMPPLLSPKRQDSESTEPPSFTQSTQDGSISRMNEATSPKDRPYGRIPNKTKVRRRLRSRTTPGERTQPLQENVVLEDLQSLRLDSCNVTGLRRRSTPLLVDSAPTTDCPIPQKPVLVRQPVRHDFTIVPEQRPDAVNAFLPPVEYPGGQGRVRSATPSYHGEDELEFRSLESADHRETEKNAPSPQVPVRSIHSSKNGRVLEDEEKERTIKFQHLKEREAESVSTSPIFAASDSSRVVMTTTEVIDLNTPVHDRVTTTVVETGQTDDPPEEELPVVQTSSGVIDLHLEVEEETAPSTTLVEEMVITAAPVKRVRRTVPVKPPTNKTQARTLNGSFPRSRPGAKQSYNNTGCLFPDTLQPVEKPRDALQQCFHKLDSPEWEVVMQGLNTMVRLSRHHPDTLQDQLHRVLVALGKQVRNLRSQVSRAACQVAGELFGSLKRALETDLDELVTPLFHRSADTNKFLRADSNAALDKMLEVISIPRAIGAIVAKGVNHQHAVVRTAAARLLVSLVSKLGTEKTMTLPRESRDKILESGANLLMEGSLDTRCYAKQLFRQLSSYPNFSRTITEVVPAPVLRNISKTLQNLK